MSIIFNPSKDFNIKEDCQLIIYDLNSKRYYKNYEINSYESITFEDEEVLSNP